MKIKTSILIPHLRRMAHAVLETWKNEIEGFNGDFIVCRHCEQAGEPRVQHDTDCPVRLARKILREHKCK